MRLLVVVLVLGEWGNRGGRTPEVPWALFSPASMALSLWAGALAYSDPRGMVYVFN